MPPKKYQTPTPGPGPAMPPLEQQFTEGMTIEQQAALYGRPPADMAAAAISRTPNSIFQPTHSHAPALPQAASQGQHAPQQRPQRSAEEINEDFRRLAEAQQARVAEQQDKAIDAFIRIGRELGVI